ncbi:hypothetical protein [Chondromyces apiculatus]|uniref:Tsi6 domain-containing protein n=1 Tax=Chondromyces apiculatus DSM 436 TaxID=1192034 RepID=A0A017TA04_9BACT|nr:hypothetical protein [Chondromyces apiculatus]EYF05456.1 Hypothetical protein CAP_3183 [Chondromyces apiculatus DSM 436]
MARPLIASREEFFRMLAETSAELDDLVKREPTHPCWRGIQEQLRAMTFWSAQGDPTPEQQGRINIGLIVVRELEPAETPELADLNSRLHLLNYAWRYWPPGK